MHLPPNSPVYTLHLLLHRNEALWGPDAHVYDPDRWLDERLQRVTNNPSIYIPFGAGPRNVSVLSGCHQSHRKRFIARAVPWSKLCI